MTRILTRGSSRCCFPMWTKSFLCPLVTGRVSKDVFLLLHRYPSRLQVVMVADSTQELLNVATLPVYIVISLKGPGLLFQS